jgi:hypothetical protein
MRKIRVIISGTSGALPALVAVLAPAVDACGSTSFAADASDDSASDQTTTSDLGFPPLDAASDEAASSGCPLCVTTVTIPPAGTFPDLAHVCVVASPVVSNTAATVTLTNYDQNLLTADGFIAVSSELLAAMIGDPVVQATFTVSGLTKVTGGYTFTAHIPSKIIGSMTARVTLQVGCGDAGLDGGVQTVQSDTDLEYCDPPDSSVPEWRSSGETCIQCCVVCEMAPTPIVSDNPGDALPLSRALRLRVVELARTSRQVLLFAQNDAGEDAEYEWHVSGGAIERVADDVVVWTLPDVHDDDAPFGQLAVWNDDGAIVENFYWGAA